MKVDREQEQLSCGKEQLGYYALGMNSIIGTILVICQY